MNEKELIRRGMKAKGVTQKDFAKKYGYTSQGTISDKLNRSKTLHVDVMVRMLDILGYDVFVIDRESGEQLGKITTKTEKPKKIKKHTPEPSASPEPSEAPSEPKPIPRFKY